MRRLLGAGALAHTVGSAGGTASLVSYPALLAAGLAPLPANVANSLAFVACLPGSALGSRPELHGQRQLLLRLAPLAAAGGAAGAVLLLVTPAALSGRIVPFLIAAAALALILQPRLSAWRDQRHATLRPGPALLAVWIYDGYWGAGAGGLALATLLLTVDAHLAGPALTRRIPAPALRDVVALAGLGLAVHLWPSPA